MCNGNNNPSIELAHSDECMHSAGTTRHNLVPTLACQLTSTDHSIAPLLADIQLQWDTCDMHSQQSDLDPDTIYRMDPLNIQQERLSCWPTLLPSYSNHLTIYNKVRSTGLPNCMGARIPLHSTLNIDVWETLAKQAQLGSIFLDMLRYGFPLQFTGKLPPDSNPKNHSSATNYLSHVKQYIQKESVEGAMIGPLDEYPFSGPTYVSPMMTRPKNGSTKRRIIVDLSYPPGIGVNSKVTKGYIFGRKFDHFLPTIDQAISLAPDLNYQVAVAVVDIERAYRNFRSDPLDWPLLVVGLEGQYFVDMALPFGARVSSLYVQQLADFIVRTLRIRNIRSLMYLDDLYLILPRDSNAQSTFTEVLAIIRSLGLPINYGKLIAPSTQAVWLGVTFDFANNIISIPDRKVCDLLNIIRQYDACQNVTIKEAQSLIGRIAHVAKVVPAARIFLNSLL